MTRPVLLLAVALFAVLFSAALSVGDRTHRNLAAGVTDPTTSAASTAARVTHPMTATAHPRVLSGRRVHPRSPHPTVLLDTTAYCWTGSRTASGVWPVVGMAASNLYRFGQRLRVPGIGVVTVTDRSAPGATDLDIYMGNEGCEQRAITFGRRALEVVVLP